MARKAAKAFSRLTLRRDVEPHQPTGDAGTIGNVNGLDLAQSVRHVGFPPEAAEYRDGAKWQLWAHSPLRGAWSSASSAPKPLVVRNPFGFGDSARPARALALQGSQATGGRLPSATGCRAAVIITCLNRTAGWCLTCLYRGTRHRSVRTEYAAVARLGA